LISIYGGQVVEAPRAVGAIVPEAGLTYVNDLLAEPLRLRVTSRYVKLFELLLKLFQVLGQRCARRQTRSQRHRERACADVEKAAYATRPTASAVSRCA
jgi:hypothetical protein